MVVFLLLNIIIIKGILWLIIGIWVVGFVFLLLLFYVLKVYIYDGVVFCIEDWVLVFYFKRVYVIYMIVFFVFLYVLFLLIIVVLYLVIVVKVWCWCLLGNVILINY